jgi:GNAT superfamily N-acetyltransferase
VGLVHVEVEEAVAPHRVRDPAAWITGIVVRADCRRQGVDRRLVEAAEQWARARGLGRVKLNVWEATGARPFYERLGYASVQHQMCRRLDDRSGGQPGAQAAPSGGAGA